MILSTSIIKQHPNSIDVSCISNVDGYIYAVVIMRDEAEPSIEQIKAGTNISDQLVPNNNEILVRNVSNILTISTLIINTNYDIWLVGEDMVGGYSTKVKLQFRTTYLYPEWEQFYPRLRKITNTTIEVLCKTDKDNTSYVIAVLGSSVCTTPTINQIINGLDGCGDPLPIGQVKSDQVDADTELVLTLTGLSEDTEYDIYIVSKTVTDTQPTALHVNTYTTTTTVEPTIIYDNENIDSISYIRLNYDSDGINGKFGKIQSFIKNPSNEYIQIKLKYNSNFDWYAGGEVTLNEKQLVENEMVYLAGQTNPLENGIYVVKTGTWEYYRSITNDLLIDLGAEVYDSVDGDLTPFITTKSSELDLNTIGFQTIYYYCVNSRGTLFKTIRKIRVIEPDSSIVPVNTFKISNYEILNTVNSNIIKTKTVSF